MTWLVLVVVAAVLAAVAIGGVLVLMLGKHPWRELAREQFDVACSPSETRERVLDYVIDRSRWQVLESSAAGVRIRTGMTWATWRMDVEVSFEPVAATVTRVLVVARCPQLVDWHDGRRAVVSIRQNLPAAQLTESAPPVQFAEPAAPLPVQS